MATAATGTAAAGGSGAIVEGIDKAVAERAAATKEVLEARLKQRKAVMAERRSRRMELNKILADPTIPEETKRKCQAEFEARERELLRDARKRYSASDFDPLCVIGRGAFGEVKLVKCKDDGRIYAMKQMHKTAMIMKNQVAHVRAERDALAASENPWVVNLHYSFQDEDHLFLVMDYCAGGDLMTLLIKEDILPEHWVRFYAAEAVQAIASVHAMGYIHRDLKPDNFLFDHRGHLKLTDLGLCKKIVDDALADVPLDSIHEGGEAAAAAIVAADAGGVTGVHHDRPMPHGAVGGGGASDVPGAHTRERRLAYSTVGTPDYIDYQVLLKKGYGFEADWWGLGTVLYECLLGFPPFYGDDPVQTCRKILHYKTTLKFPADRCRSLSPEAIDFLKGLITDADRRLGTRGGADELRAHPWFKGLDWSRLHEMEAPWQPANGAVIGGLLDRMAGLGKDEPEFAACLKTLTSNFDDFSNLAADDPRHGFPGGHGPAGGDGSGSSHGKAGGPSSRFSRKFVGFTFKRATDGSGKPVLVGPPTSGSASASTSASPSTGSGASTASLPSAVSVGSAGGGMRVGGLPVGVGGAGTGTGASTMGTASVGGYGAATTATITTGLAGMSVGTGTGTGGMRQ